MLPAGSSTAQIPQLPSLSTGDTVEFADRVLRVVSVQSPGVYQVENATPFDVFTALSISSRRTASSQGSKLTRERALALSTLNGSSQPKWLTFVTDRNATAKTIYSVAKEFLDCTTFAAVEVAARPTLHASGSSTFSGYQFSAKDCTVLSDGSGTVKLDQDVALGAEGDVTIDPASLTIGFSTEGAYSTRTKVTVAASGMDTKSTHRLVNLVPDFLNPESTTQYPETIMTLRKMLTISIYLDLVLLHDIRGAKASAEFSGAGDFAFGGTAVYDKATKEVRFTAVKLNDGSVVSADPAKSGVSLGVDQFDGQLGGGLQLGYLIDFSQSTADSTANWLTRTVGEAAASSLTSGVSASMTFNARARAALGAFLDLNVGRDIAAADCRFALKGSLGYDNFYAFGYRVGASTKWFEWKDGPQFLFTDPTGVFTIRDFVATPTQLIDGAKFCGPNSVLQLASEGQPRLVLRNNATGQSLAVDSAGGIAQLSKPIPVRDLRGYSIEVNTSAIAAYRASGITYKWTSSEPAKVPIAFDGTSQVMLFPLCNNECPPKIVATVTVAYGTRSVDLPVHIPLDNFPTPRGRFGTSAAGTVLDAGASSDPEGAITEYQWVSPSGLVERTTSSLLAIPASSSFTVDLLSSGQSPSLVVTDSRGQRAESSAVFDGSLAPIVAPTLITVMFDDFSRPALDASKWRVDPCQPDYNGQPATYGIVSGELRIDVPGGSNGVNGKCSGSKFVSRAGSLSGDFESTVRLRELLRQPLDGYKDNSGLIFYFGDAHIAIAGNHSGYWWGAPYNTYQKHRIWATGDGGVSSCLLDESLDLDRLYEVEFRIRREAGVGYMGYRLVGSQTWTERTCPMPTSGEFALLAWSGDGGGTARTGRVQLAVDDFAVKLPWPKGQPDLLAGTWAVSGIDLGGTSWGGSKLTFVSQTQSAQGFDVAGYFNWIGSNGSYGRENFVGSLGQDGVLTLTGTQLVAPVSGLVLGSYRALLTLDSRRLVGGSWTATGGIDSSSWSAERQ